jgi:hypothetical protein
MFGTVFLEAYREDEKEDVLKAIHALTGSGGLWSSVGIYCYFNPSTALPLYIGKAMNVGSRFSQHNLAKSKPGSNKRAKIDHYFQNNEVLGVSLLLLPSAFYASLDGLNNKKHRRIKNRFNAAIESILILKQTKAKLSWNIQNGSRLYLNQLRRDTHLIVGAMCGKLDTTNFWLTASETIRELPQTHENNEFETVLSFIRFQMLFLNKSLVEACNSAGVKSTTYQQAFNQWLAYDNQRGGFNNTIRIVNQDYQNLLNQTRILCSSYNLQKGHPDFQFWDLISSSLIKKHST